MAAYPRDYQSRYGVLRGWVHSGLQVHRSRRIAAITQHIPDKRFHMVRYYGWYSNKMRGQRRKRAEEAACEYAAAEQWCGAGANSAVETAVEIIEHRESKPRRIPSRSWRELIKLDHEGLGS